MSFDLMPVSLQILKWALLIQTLELIILSKKIDSIWKFEILKKDYPLIVQNILGLFLKFPSFHYLLIFRFFMVVLFLDHWTSFLFLLGTQALISFRFRGNFNGGSDFLSFQVLLALTIMKYFGSSVSYQFGLLYIVVNVCLSYFVAGIVKIKSSNWRSGAVLVNLANSMNYNVPKNLNKLVQKFDPKIFSWGLMIFEITFPLSLLNNHLALCYLGAGLIFHLANWYFLGLNRFFWIWVSTYPLVYLVSV